MFTNLGGLILSIKQITLNFINTTVCFDVAFPNDNEDCDRNPRNFTIQLTWTPDPEYTLNFLQDIIVIAVIDDGKYVIGCSLTLSMLQAIIIIFIEYIMLFSLLIVLLTQTHLELPNQKWLLHTSLLQELVCIVYHNVFVPSIMIRSACADLSTNSYWQYIVGGVVGGLSALFILTLLAILCIVVRVLKTGGKILLLN